MPHEHSHPPSPVADASVRLARADDAAAIGGVQAGLWRDLYAGTLPPEVVAGFKPAAFAGVWGESLASPPSPAYRALVACSGLDVVGFAAVGPSQDADATDMDAEVLVMGVDQGARRVGHGSRLVNAVADTARGSGFARLRVWVPGAAPDLARFLGAAGFEADGATRDRLLRPSDADADVQHEVRLIATIPE